MITTEGIIIQIRVAEVSHLGRITSGVKLINLDEGVKVAQIAKVREKIVSENQEFETIDEAIEAVGESEMDDSDFEDEDKTYKEETEENTEE